MMKEFNESAGRGEEISRINERGAEKAALAAQLLCRETVELAFDSVELYLQADFEQHDRLKKERYPTGEVRGYYVLQDKFTAPRSDGNFQRTYSIRLEPTAKTIHGHFMKLHVPVGAMNIHTYEMPAKETVNEVYIEATDGEDVHWYAVQKNGLYEYIPHVRQDEESSVLSDQGIWEWINDRIPENGETIMRILRQAVNWGVVPQRIEPVQEITLDPPQE